MPDVNQPPAFLAPYAVPSDGTANNPQPLVILQILQTDRPEHSLSGMEPHEVR
jgi:hypothetical protein